MKARITRRARIELLLGFILFAVTAISSLALATVTPILILEIPLWIVLFSFFLGAFTSWLFGYIRKWKSATNLSAVLRTIAEEPDAPQGPRHLADSSRDLIIHHASLERLRTKIYSLRQEKRRADLVLESMTDGILSVDCQGHITLCNRTAETIFNCRASNILGLKLEEADLHPQVSRLVYECIGSREPASEEVTLPGLPPKVIGIYVTPFRSPHTGPDCVLIIIHDLSEIRKHEKNQKEFVSNVSHELRTPITAVRATAEALLSGAKYDEELLDKFLGNIISESERLSNLIEDLMELARRDAGIISTNLDEAVVTEMVDRAVSVTQPQAEQGQVELRLDVPEELTVVCDEKQIVQLIRNLVENAIKYTPEGGRVCVAARRTETGVEISVSDTGIGIPHSELDRIFDRFYRVDKARSRKLGGTGLGLSIVKHIVQAHGGEISVESKLSEGSKFTFKLPDLKSYRESD